MTLIFWKLQILCAAFWRILKQPFSHWKKSSGSCYIMTDLWSSLFGSMFLVTDWYERTQHTLCGIIPKQVILDRSSTAFVQAATGTMSPCVISTCKWLCHVQKTLCHSGPLWPLALTTSGLLSCNGPRVSGRECDWETPFDWVEWENSVAEDRGGRLGGALV